MKSVISQIAAASNHIILSVFVFVRSVLSRLLASCLVVAFSLAESDLFLKKSYIPGIISYMEGQVGPSSKLKPTLREVKEFVKDATDDLVILGIFKDESDPLFVTFLEANNDLRDEYSFGHTFDKKTMSHFGVKESSILVVHPRHLVSQYEPKYQVFKVARLIF